MGPEYYQNAPEEIKAHQKVPKERKNEQNNTKRFGKTSHFFWIQVTF